MGMNLRSLTKILRAKILVSTVFATSTFPFIPYCLSWLTLNAVVLATFSLTQVCPKIGCH